MEDLTFSLEEGQVISIRVGALIEKDGRFLMASNPSCDYLYTVGGRVQFSESSREAVEREVFEETGCHMKAGELAAVHENFFISDFGKYKGSRYFELAFYYRMQVPEDFEPVCLSFSEDGHKEYLRWVSREDHVRYYPDFLFQMENEEEVKHYITKEW